MLEVLPIVAPVFVCAGLGWGWARLGRAYDRALITQLIFDVGAPCLVFSSLVALDVTADALAGIAGGALLAMACFAAIGFAVLRVAGLPAHTYLGPLVFPNSGNLGLPLCLFAFGDEGLALGVAFFATVSLAHYTLGVWLWSGLASPVELLRTPLFYAVLLAAGVLAAELPVPRWIRNTTELLGSLTIPLMLLTLGVALGELATVRAARTAAISALRLGMGFGVGVGLAAWLELEGAARGVFIIECAMPVAVFNFLFAERYHRSPEAVASLVVVSTLLAFAALPLLLAFVV